MSPSELARRIADLPTLSAIPADEVEWLVRHGAHLQYGTGDIIARRGDRIEHLWIILSGRISVHRDTAAGRRRVMSWVSGEVTGRLPYSRMTASAADIRLDEPTETLGLHERHFAEMVHHCPRFTEHTVHLMIDRVRRFKTSELQVEKLVSLGRLSAGLAHELNNPASATIRGASLLRQGLEETEEASRRLFSAGLSESNLAAVAQIRAACLEVPRDGVPSALEQADREEEIEGWLAEHGCDPHHAMALADTSVTLGMLGELARELPAPALEPAVQWLGASCSTRSVAADIEGAAQRIHALVAAVKRFTYMDNLTSNASVEVGQGLRDTVTVLAAKARTRGASVRLDIAPDLPPVRANGSELNQVWMNLVDNALDAVPDGGEVSVGARMELDRVAVRVVDDGPGIPDDVLQQIFDPFFTTKGPGGGTGLGLDIARRIVTQNGGEIDVESQPGRTEFRVRLHPETEPAPDPPSSA